VLCICKYFVRDIISPFTGSGKAAEQMYLFLGQEEMEGGPLSTLHTDLLAALQNIKQLQPPLTTLEGEKRGICALEVGVFFQRVLIDF
jgi:hypothetical protein